MIAEAASLDEVLPFRRARLRPPGHPVEPPKPGDLLATCRHFVVRDPAGAIAAAATIHPDQGAAWQLRAVASTMPGGGRAVVEACLAHARSSGASLVWCHGRVGARGFYERLGFVAVGEIYDVPVSGPHLRMERRLISGAPSSPP